MVERGVGGSMWLAITGAIFLVCFIVICAASFHHVDRMLGLQLGVLRLNVALELGGILAILLAAWLRLRCESGSAGIDLRG